MAGAEKRCCERENGRREKALLEGILERHVALIDWSRCCGGCGGRQTMVIMIVAGVT
jgi:predicted metal-binding protein